MIVKYPNLIVTHAVHGLAGMPLEPGSEYRPMITEAIAKLREEAAKLSPAPLGLAANQVGVNLPVFLIGNEAFVSPQVVARRGSAFDLAEGCYSLVDGHVYNVRRQLDITVRYHDEKFRPHTDVILAGRKAQIFQHEMDHLRGKLCWERDGRDVVGQDMRALESQHYSPMAQPISTATTSAAQMPDGLVDSEVLRAVLRQRAYIDSNGDIRTS